MKILLVSLGCDKNLVDSEVMLGLLAKEGYTFTDDETQADIAVINTCCFINDAKEESINTILEIAELKKAGQIKALIVTGCLAQRYQEEIQKEIEEVDAIIGTAAIDKIASAIEDALNANTADAGKYFEPLDRKPAGNRKRIMTTGGHFAYLKIAEGCDKNCTYCVIPKVRGPYRSIPMEELVAEAEALVQEGARVDSGSAGNYPVRQGFVWGENAAGPSRKAVRHQKATLDSDSILLSGGDYG